jgi:ubiquinone/menaquinone biosynthesis C-methylase UbiE
LPLGVVIVGSMQMAEHHGAEEHLHATRTYYDEFSERYERHRRPNDPGGYHALVDDLEIDLCERYGTDKDVLECGCGTGLLLERIAGFARRAVGIDLSPGMLELARARDLEAVEGSVTSLPFDDASFDVACSFKVLAHVRDIGRALAEMARVTRPGGVVLAEFYNPISFRGLAKRLGPAGAISERTRESAVYTRFDAPWTLPRILPPGARLEAARGIRIVTPAAAAMRVPGLRGMLRAAEWFLCDSPAAVFGGFYVAVIRCGSKS